MKKFFEEFKKFAMRGNVIDLAVGVVIGGAFGKITTSIVNDIIMPVVGMLTGGIAFEDWKIVLKEAVLDAEGAVKAAEVAIRYGNTIAIILDFIIVAFAVFCIVKAINAMHAKAEELRKKEEEEAAAEPPAPPAPPEPSAEEKLLTEIRDLLKAQK
ncbi:MAG: large-conductance mechanosensitive channel protein MscL [Ruminococcaceae bacterium]|nr:large-conductance mechanosensitive channel protein MscL [Oscillospiraceae bacterium]